MLVWPPSALACLPKVQQQSNSLPWHLASCSAVQVEMVNNSASSGGGAIYVQSGTLSLSGHTKIVNNSCGGPGGAIYIYAYTSAATLSVTNTLCMEGNTATIGGAIYITGTAGGFSIVDFNSSQVTMADNKPDAVTITAVGSVYCNATGLVSWKPGSYIITGSPCDPGCAANFSTGASTVCDTCTAGWDPGSCACKVRAWQSCRLLIDSSEARLVAECCTLLSVFALQVPDNTQVAAATDIGVTATPGKSIALGSATTHTFTVAADGTAPSQGVTLNITLPHYSAIGLLSVGAQDPAGLRKCEARLPSSGSCSTYRVWAIAI